MWLKMVRCTPRQSCRHKHTITHSDSLSCDSFMVGPAQATLCNATVTMSPICLLLKSTSAPPLAPTARPQPTAHTHVQLTAARVTAAQLAQNAACRICSMRLRVQPCHQAQHVCTALRWCPAACRPRHALVAPRTPPTCSGRSVTAVWRRMSSTCPSPRRARSSVPFSCSLLRH
jgi:hypothetical protein